MDTTSRDHGNGNADGQSAADRRTFLSKATSLGMLAGLTASYGTAGAFAARYMYPAKPREKGWMFVARVADIPAGGSLRYRTPAGEGVAVARQGMSGTVEDFVALSSTCPHLGCQVHWESTHQRFFCPCHNGTFDKGGTATGGPPGDAGMRLPRYPLKVEGGLLYIEVPVESNSQVAQADTRGGHDACLGDEKAV